MKLRAYIVALSILLVMGILGLLLLFPVPQNAVDIARINDMMRNGETIDKTIFAEMIAHWQIYRLNLQIFMIVLFSLLAVIAGVFFYILQRKVLQPFERMRSFAQRVAAGELDIPLNMDKGNAFGAFTESFDLMREELKRARENERAAEQSKRELVASLSHDIQTPVASIRAVAELMALTADEAGDKKLQIIQEKAGQIGGLVSDLFHTTLEELHSISVKPVSIGSDAFVEIIKKADFQGKAKIEAIPGCLVLADPVRLSQVIDNIMANAYKYADTEIHVSSAVDEKGLTLLLRDFGAGALPEELPLLCQKYYRGKAAEEKNGYGLGLYISRSFMEQMNGSLECENAKPGFAVRLWLQFDRG